MYEVKQQNLGNGTSLFIITKEGKRFKAYVADSITDKELEKLYKELNKDELKKEGSGRRKRAGKQTP